MVDEVAGLTVKVDSTDVKRSSGDLDKFAKQAKVTEQAVDKLERETGQFSKTAKATSVNSQELNRSVSNYGSVALTAARGVGSLATAAGVAAGALAAYSISTANAVRETDAIARSVGVSTPVLQQWGFAVESVGFSTEKIGDIFKDTAEKIGDFVATGGGEAKDVFEQLNLQASDLAALSPDQQLIKVAEALGQVQTQGEKIFILESLANDASRLLPLLEDDAEALEKLINQASEFDLALTDEENNRLIELANASNVASGAIRGLGNTISAALAPSLVDFLNLFVEGVKPVNDLFEAIDRGIRATRGELTNLEQFNALFQRRIEIQNELQRLQEDPSFFEELYGDRTQATIRALNAELEENTKLLSEIQEEQKQLTIAEAEQAETKKPLIALTGNLADEQKRLNAELKEGQAIFNSTRTASEKFAIEQAKLTNLLNSGAINADTYQRAIGQARAELQEFNRATIQANDEGGVLAEISATIEENALNEADAIRDVTSALEEQRRQQEETFSNLGDLLANAVTGTQSLSSIFRTIGTDFLSGGFSNLARTGTTSGSAGFGDFLSGGFSTFQNFIPKDSLSSISSFFDFGNTPSPGVPGVPSADIPGGSFFNSLVGFGVSALAVPILSNLFGGEPSDRTQGSQINLRTGELTTEGGATGDKFSQQNLDLATQVGLLSSEFSQFLSDLTGETVDSPLSFLIGDRDGLRVRIDQEIVATVDSAEKLFDETGRILTDLFGITSEVYDKVALENENFIQTVTRVEQQFALTNDIAERLGITFLAVNDQGREAANVFVQAAGGLETLAANSDFYYQNFFTDEERASFIRDKAQEEINAFNAEIGLSGAAAIDSRDELREYIEAQDLSTNAGANAVTTALELAEAITLVDEGFDSATDTLKDAAQSAFDALRTAIDAEQDAANATIKETESNIATLDRLSSSLSSTLGRLSFESEQFDRQSREQAASQIADALSVARSGGIVDQDQLTGALREIEQPSAELASSFNDYQRDFFIQANRISELKDLTDVSLSTEEQALAVQEQELERLQSIEDAAQAQIDAINGVDNSVQSVEAALIAFNTASQGAGGGVVTSTGGTVGTGTSVNDQEGLISALYTSGLGREPDAAGLAFWTDQLRQPGVSFDQVKAGFFTAAEENNEGTINAFANGGIHTGGIRLVGERGPELEVTGPSRIISNQEIMRGLGSNSENDNSINMLKFTMDKMLSFLERIYNLESKWDADALNVRVVT